jgi:hypothetical protein
VQRPLERWAVDAPQVTRLLALERLEDQPGRNPPRNAGLDDGLRTQMDS